MRYPDRKKRINIFRHPDMTMAWRMALASEDFFLHQFMGANKNIIVYLSGYYYYYVGARKISTQKEINKKNAHCLHVT